jgi:hypothetical protein
MALYVHRKAKLSTITLVQIGRIYEDLQTCKMGCGDDWHRQLVMPLCSPVFLFLNGTRLVEMQFQTSKLLQSQSLNQGKVWIISYIKINGDLHRDISSNTKYFSSQGYIYFRFSTSVTDLYR